jgi:hypothetical protein
MDINIMMFSEILATKINMDRTDEQEQDASLLLHCLHVLPLLDQLELALELTLHVAETLSPTISHYFSTEKLVYDLSFLLFALLPSAAAGIAPPCIGFTACSLFLSATA